MKILDFNLEGNHFIIEADIKTDDNKECQWLQYRFENTQIYKETDGIVLPFTITAVAWAGYQLTTDHALKDVIGRISRNETGKLTVHYVCPELQVFLDKFKKYPAIIGERIIPYFIFHHDDIARLVYSTNEFLYYTDSNDMLLMFRTHDGTLVSDNELANMGFYESERNVEEGTEYILPFTDYDADMESSCDSAWGDMEKAKDDRNKNSGFTCMTSYYLHCIAAHLHGEYRCDSYFYNTHDYTARIYPADIEAVKSETHNWALVMFDYHY